MRYKDGGETQEGERAGHPQGKPGQWFRWCLVGPDSHMLWVLGTLTLPTSAQSVRSQRIDDHLPAAVSQGEYYVW